MDTVVVLSETGELQLTSLYRHALYHAVSVLLPNQSMTAVLPKSGSMKVESFCSDLPQAISAKVRNKKPSSLSSSSDLGNPLIASLEIHKFLEHAVSIAEFTESIERQFLDMSGGEIDAQKLHEICWNVYQMEKGQEISIRHWFSPTCTQRMWLIFCCVQEQALSDTLSAKTTNEVIKRVGELCGYTWNEAAYSYTDTSELTFPQYIRAIANYFTKLQLEMSLTCEVIGDMVDEIVYGVLKKGFLQKKGHKRKNWKRRWFVLHRTIIKYFETRDNLKQKGQLVLNSKTDVKSIPDKGKRKCLFEVTCGHTGTPFEISADDQRTKHEWILAIKKAIALAKVLDGSSKQDDFGDHLSGFYLLKYGTPQPHLNRQDSTVRNMKYYATFRDQRQRLSGRKTSNAEDQGLNDSGSSENSTTTTPQEEYLPMNPLHKELDYSDESSDDDSYTSMSPIKEMRSIDSRLSKSSEYLVDMAVDEDKSKDWADKGLSKSYSIRSQSTFLPSKLSEEKTSSDDDNVYDEAGTMPRYTANPRAMDKELGGYIDVANVNKKNSNNRKSLSLKKNLATTSISEEEDDDEVSKMTARTMTLDPVPEADRAPSPNNYLTIVRGEGSPAEENRRSKTMEPIVYKPPKPHVPLHGTSLSLDSRTNAPPPVMPRSVAQKSSPPHTRSKPSHRTSTSYTSNYENTVPPLPPR